MIVALGAADGHAHERAGHNLEGFGHHLIAGVVVVGRAGAVRCHAEIAGGGELVDLVGLQLGMRRLHHLVTGELFANELIPGQILVEGVHYIITITPGPGAFGIFFIVALRIRVACDIQPMPAPAHAVLRRGEQTIDQLGVGVGRLVGDEILHFLRRGRQAGEVKGGAPDQRGLVRGGGKLQPLRVQAAQ